MVNAERQLARRTLEGHFACGSGIYVTADCLNATYISRTASHDMLISLPGVGPGVLEPPSFCALPATADEERKTVEGMRWGIVNNWIDRPDGEQIPTDARVERIAFVLELEAADLSPLGRERLTAMREVDAWWGLFAQWASLFTAQDVADGSTLRGIQAGPVWTWECDQGLRRKPSSNTSWPIRHEPPNLLDHATLEACMTLTACGDPPPDEWLFIADARSLINTGDYRRAVIDAGTAAELAMTEILDQYFAATETNVRDAVLSRSRTLEGRATLIKELRAAQIPPDFTSGLKTPRNRAAHGGERPSRTAAATAVRIATEIVEQAHPVLGLIPSPASASLDGGMGC